MSTTIDYELSILAGRYVNFRRYGQRQPNGYAVGDTLEYETIMLLRKPPRLQQPDDAPVETYRQWVQAIIVDIDERLLILYSRADALFEIDPTNEAWAGRLRTIKPV